jgi:NAD(P)-dependent dehydrogenase (short-subunit alcohol dehydrogenase family)
MGKLDGKVAIVTGASRGIGEYIAKLFAKEGGKVVCAARTLKEGDHIFEGSLQKTCDDINADGGQATPVAVNISLPEDCEKLIEETHNAYGPVDVLVNNAALTYFESIKDYKVNRWMRTWAVNVHAPFILSQLVLEDMIPRKAGSIVNISSSSAIGPGRGPYSAEERQTAEGDVCYGSQKAALERFTQGMAAEVFEYGVSITCLSPSLVVPTPGTVYHNLVTGIDDPTGEHPDLMAQSTLLLATEPQEKITGRVTYSQQILSEFGWMSDARGTGVDAKDPGSGYSQI